MPQSLTRRRLPVRALTASTLALLLAAACGGGSTEAGGGSGNGPAAPPETGDNPATVAASFSPSDADFPSPERGYFRYTSDLSRLDTGFLDELAQQGTRLVYTPNDLGAWRTQALPASYLNALTAGFAQLRARGLKAVLRFAYNYPANETDYQNAQDASLAQVQAHIAQLQPIVSANADVIAVWQAGFIGAWGEWHTSSNGLTSAASKRAVRDALLQALPAGRQLQVRYPGDLMAWYPTAPTATDLGASAPPEATRIGMHNDCFLASPDDVGTYFPASTSAQARRYVQTASGVTGFGGETCSPPNTATARMTCADILGEGAAYHLAYLNRDYFKGFFDAWTAGQCLDTVARSMGYRLVLERIEHTEAASAGQTVLLALSLHNVGWARPMNPRALVLRLVPATAGAKPVDISLPASDLRQLGAGDRATWSLRAVLPAGIATGRWQVHIGAPDPAPSLAGKPDYALRFANQDGSPAGARWVPETAFWATGTALQIR